MRRFVIQTMLRVLRAPYVCVPEQHFAELIRAAYCYQALASEHSTGVPEYDRVQT